MARHCQKVDTTMAAFSLNHSALITAALNAITPGMERVCVLPAVTFVKLTRVVNLVQADTTVTASGDDQCPPGSIDLPSAPAPSGGAAGGGGGT
jgi:hypothetical protein